MSKNDRDQQILQYLQKNQAITVKQLASLLFASEATVRRDLKKLEANGQLQRFYGGVTLPLATDAQVPLVVREREMGESKRRVAQMAKEKIRDGDTLFMDGSSTCLALVPLLAGFRNLTVVTNGLKTAALLSEQHITTYCTGGRLIENSQAFSGADAVHFAERYHADLCLLSCKGISDEGVCSDTSESETELRRAFMRNADRRFLLMTSNKIGKTYLHVLGSSRDFDAILSDDALPPFALRKSK